MLAHDLRTIGNRLFIFRKKSGKTQAEIAEAAGVADRTYADIERGTVNIRIETMLRICEALHITPDDLFVDEHANTEIDATDILERLKHSTRENKEAALQIIEIFLDSHGG